MRSASIPRGMLKQVAAAPDARVDADVGVNGQPGRRVGDERVERFSQPASPGEMRPRFHEGHVGRHRRMVRPAEFGDHRADGRILVAVAVDARRGVEIAGLKDLVRLVVAVAGVDRTNEREAIEHRRLFRQVLANMTPGSRVAIGENGPRFS